MSGIFGVRLSCFVQIMWNTKSVDDNLFPEAHTDNGTAVRNITTDVPPHGVTVLLLKDAGDEPAGLFPDCSVWWQCTVS